MKPALQKKRSQARRPFDRATSFRPKLMIVRFATVVGITVVCGLSSKQIPQRSKSGVFSAVCLEFRI